MQQSELASMGTKSPELGHNLDSLDRGHQLKASHLIFKKFLEIILMICNWDLFLIYKVDNKQDGRAKDRVLVSSPELQIGQNNFDRWQERFRKPFLFLIGLLSLRLAIISLVQVIDMVLLDLYIFDSDRLNNLSGSTRSQIIGFLSTNVLRTFMPSYYRAVIGNVLKFGKSVRDPFWSLTGVTVFLEIVLAPPVFYLFIIVPLNQRKKPLDSPNQRLMLDPTREIRRIDYIIKRKLESILIECSRDRLDLGKLEQIADLRPLMFNQNWFHSIYRKSLIMCSLVVVQNVTLLATSIYSLSQIAKKSICTIQQIDDCSYGNIFSAYDAIYITEVIVTFILGAVYFNLVMLFFVCTNIAAQLSVIKGVNYELNQCLTALSIYNMRSRQSDLSDYERTIFSANPSLESSSRHLPSYLFRREERSGEQEIELSLLKTYIKLVVTSDEMKHTARFIGTVTELILEMIGYLIFTIFVSFIYNGFAVQMTHVVLFINCFLLTNPMMLACSYVFARTVALEKVAWSILAELSIYLTQRKGYPRLYNSNEQIEVLATRWRRLVHSHALSDQRIASSPFGLRMTYKQVINIDFFIITIALVLVTR